MAGFEVNEAPGKLTFENDYVIPNPAVRFDEEATLSLWFRNLVGDDVEVVDGTVFYPRVAKAARANIALEVSHHASSSGVASVDSDSARARQLKENLAELATVADLTETTGSQTVTYTPWIGATPVDLTMVVLPPIEGSAVRGIGARAGLGLILYPAVSEDG